MPHPLDVFIPIDRRFALHHRTTLPEHSFGTALFADISGFTAITEALVEELGAHRAVEELTYQLNQVYDALIAEVHNYGGAVIGFVGDAITCWFDAELPVTQPPPQPDSYHRAVTCALAMQRAMANFAHISLPTAKVVSLFIKIGIASGPVKRFVVGDSTIQRIDTVAGTTLQRMALAEKQAANNEILIDEATQQPLKDYLTITELRPEPGSGELFAVITHLSQPAKPTPWPAIPPLPKTKPWLLKPVFQESKLNQRELLPDLRPAVSLFLKFEGLDYDQDSDAGDKLNEYIQWVQRTVNQYNGLLIQLTIGDRGSFLYVAFGADVAHEDDAARAVSAAKQLINPPINFITTTQIGLARGQARVGPYGSKDQRSYGVIGDDAILAHRLMMATNPGQILCDYNIFRATRNDWAFDELPAIYVKGKSNPVKVYRPQNKHNTFNSQQAIATTRLDLIGREAESYILKMLLDRVQAGANRLLIIEGPAGIGKSHLISEFIKEAQSRELSTLMGHGLSSENQLPYQAWRDIFNLYFGLENITDLEKRQQWVKMQVGGLASHLNSRLPLLNDVLSLGLPENVLTGPMDPALRHQSLVSLLLDLLLTWAKDKPPIIILEDATWLDTVSWDLALQIARRFAATETSLLMIILVRPLTTSPETKTYLQLANLPQTEHIILSPLSAEATHQLAANRLELNPQNLPRNISHFLYNQTEGNPFYIEELILTLRERKLITIEPGEDEASSQVVNRCIVEDNFEQALTVLPDTIQGLILSRIDRLKPEQQWLLKVAAVIGHTVSFSVLSYVLQQHPNYNYVDLRTSIEAFIFLEFFRLETTEPEYTFAFQQLITHEVAYQTLLYAQRRDLHLTVAQWFESHLEAQSKWHRDYDLMQVFQRPVSSSPYLPLIVHHYHHAEEYEQERYYAILVGKQAAAEFANVEAIRYYSRALELTSTQHLELRFELLLIRENLYDLQANRTVQLADLSAMQEMVDALPTQNFSLSTARKGQIMLRQASYYEATGDYQTALNVAEQLIKFALQHDDPVTQCEGYIIRGIALWRQAKYKTAHKTQRKALKLAQKLKNKALTAKAYHYLALTYAYQEDYHKAGDFYQQAISIYQETGDIQGQARSLLNSARVHYAQGNYQATQEISIRALNVCKPIGDRRSEAIVLGNLGIVYGDLGLYEQAHSYLEEALILSVEMANPQLQSANLGALGTIYRLTGQYSKGSEACQQAISINKNIGDRYGEGYALTNLAHILEALNDFDKAEEIYKQALNLRDELGQHNSALDDKAGLARVALVRNDLPQAQAYVENILDWINTQGTEGVDEPIWVYLTCYRVLKMQNKAGATAILERAYQFLQGQLSQITKADLKQAFLENVKINQELLALWQAEKAKPQ